MPARDCGSRFGDENDPAVKPVTDLPNPVIRSHYRNGFIKQYVRDQSGKPQFTSSFQVR
jgi:hypothetical protein